MVCFNWYRRKQNYIACWLVFECTNNVAKYEALIQGIIKSFDLKDKFIKFFGDSKIIVIKIRKNIHYVSTHWKNYQIDSWDFINHFDDFNINFVPRLQNFDADLLDNVASRLNATKQFAPDAFSIELICIASIHYNFTN